MTIDAAAFRSILGHFATGVTVLTTRDGEGTDHGMTVSAFSSLSLDPPLVLVCIDQATEMHRALQTATRFAVNILSTRQEALSRRFAEVMDDRFTGIGFSRGATECAILDDVLAFAECELIGRHTEGDHTIFIGRVIAGEVGGGQPLLYYRGGYAALER